MIDAVIVLKSKYYNKAEQILICFEYNTAIINVVRRIPHRKWSSHLQCWHVPRSNDALATIKSICSQYSIDDTELIKTPKIHTEHHIKFLTPEQRLLLNNFYKYLRGKRYSASTVDTYTHLIADFLAYNYKRIPADLTIQSIEHYIEDIYIKRSYSISKQRQFISALKIFKNYYPLIAFESIALNRPKKADIYRQYYLRSR